MARPEIEITELSEVRVNNIQRMVKELDMNTAEFSRHCGISQSSIPNAVKAKSNVGTGLANKIIAACNLSLRQFDADNRKKPADFKMLKDVDEIKSSPPAPKPRKSKSRSHEEPEETLTTVKIEFGATRVEKQVTDAQLRRILDLIVLDL